MASATRETVRKRAGGLCEYCRLSQELAPYARFHVEHIIARQHGGGSELDNLAWSCFNCNIYKGTNLSGIDPITGSIVVLYHPRREVWEQHFAVQDTLIVGLTPTGRATAAVLRMNDADQQELRAELAGQ